MRYSLEGIWFTPLVCCAVRLVLRSIIKLGVQQRIAISAEAFYFSGGEVEAVQLVEDMDDTSGEPAVGVEAAQVFKSGGRKN